MMVTFSHALLVGNVMKYFSWISGARAWTMAQQERVCLDACRQTSRTGGHGCERWREGMNEHVHNDLLLGLVC